MKKGFDIRLLVKCLLIVFAISMFGSLFTINKVNSEWYESVKPAISPPNWVFGPTWTVLFILIAVSLYLCWKSASEEEQGEVMTVFGLNLIFNAFWSMFYFGFESPGVAFIDIVFIWLSIIWMIMVSWKINKKATYLLIPYFLWVSFAAVLNFLSI